MKKSSLSQSVEWAVQSSLNINAVHNGKPIVTPATARVSINQMTTLRWSLLEEVLQAKASGYDAIGLWRPKVAEIGEDLAAELIRDSGLGVSSLSFVGGFTGVNGLGYDEAIADARDAILDAELLGADNVIVVSGSRNGHTIRHSRRLVRDALCELAEFAESRGISLSLLPMHSFFSDSWTFLNSLDETLEVLGQVNHPLVRLAFDTYHMWQEPGIIERIPDVAPMTAVVQISDACRAPQSTADRCLPGEGIIPLGEVVRAFQLSGFDGYYDVQVWSTVSWSGDYSLIANRCREAVVQLAEQPQR